MTGKREDAVKCTVGKLATPDAFSGGGVGGSHQRKHVGATLEVAQELQRTPHQRWLLQSIKDANRRKAASRRNFKALLMLPPPTGSARLAEN